MRPRNAPGAVASLVCGLVGLLPLAGGIVGLILGATAVVSALHARNAIRRSPPHRFAGPGLATAGLVLGIIAMSIGALLFLVLLAVGASRT